MRPLLVLTIGLLLVIACSSGEEGDEATRPEPRIASVDLTIGVAEGEEPYMFGRIGGIAVGDQGRIFVVDGQAGEVRVFGPEGQHQFTFGGEGGGPGELSRPCCIAFGPEGDLWVRDDQNRRYTRFHVGRQQADPVDHVRMPHSAFGLRAETTFDGEGHLIDVGSAEAEAGEFRLARYHRTRADSTIRTEPLPEAPEDRIPRYEASMGRGMRVFYRPFGAHGRRAHGPGGDWAFAITDRYQVVRFDARGDTMHVIEREVRGPDLSGDEQEWAENRVGEIAEQADVSRAELPFGVPDRKPPLDDLFFDANGRLWVRRTVVDTVDTAVADVYDSEGRLAEVVRWPKDVDLAHGAIRDSVAYGVRGGGSRPPQVLRLRY